MNRDPQLIEITKRIDSAKTKIIEIKSKFDWGNRDHIIYLLSSSWGIFWILVALARLCFGDDSLDINE